jgi:hypothetical protein
MFWPIPTIIWFTSERVLVFIRFMWLSSDGEISPYVVVIIYTIKLRGWVGGGVFCNVGIVLTCGAVLAEVYICVAAVLCGVAACCLSISDVYRRRALAVGSVETRRRRKIEK